MRLTDKQLQAFWAKVDRRGRDECWDWKAAKKKRGYGNIKVNGKVYSAHVISWMLATGQIPELLVLHSCDNPSCVNPRHLSEGEHHKNMEEMRRRGRAAKKLTLAQVIAIRQAGGTQRHIATQYGISHRTVGQIQRGQTWHSGNA